MLTAKTIGAALLQDSKLSKWIKQQKNGENQEEKYSLQEGVIFKGNRVMIPDTLQASVLSELHATHVKTSKMKSLSQRYCYWKNIDRDIQSFVKSCDACASPLHP